MSELPISTFNSRVKEAFRIWNEASERPVPGVEWIQSYATDVSDLLSRVEELEKEEELREQGDLSKRLTLSRILWGKQEYSPVFPASWENLYSAFEKRVDTPYPAEGLIAETERLKSELEKKDQLLTEVRKGGEW